MYRIFYWKSVKSGATNPIVILDPNDSNCDNTASISNGEEFCIRNDLCNLKKEDTGILHSQSAWLNDRIMDAVQKLICETLGEEKSYHCFEYTKGSRNTFRPSKSRSYPATTWWQFMLVPEILFKRPNADLQKLNVKFESCIIEEWLRIA